MPSVTNLADVPARRAPQAVDTLVVDDGVDPPASVDRLLHASIGRVTMGLAPSALWLAYADWAIHLSGAPGKRQQLAEKAVPKAIRYATYLSRLGSHPDRPPCIEPLP
jgi:polyhydroxyalkanoate synthase subunit PhaC